MIHTTLTIHSFEGIMVVVIIGVLGIGLCVFYILWQRARVQLMKYHSFLGEDKRKANKISPIADTIPIISGHGDSSSNATDEANPMTAPPSKLMAILRNVSPIKRIIGAESHE